MQIFSFSPHINSSEDGKWLLRVTSFEGTISVFNFTIENKSFSITIPGRWQTKFDEKLTDELNKILEPWSLELHVKEAKKRGKKINYQTKNLNYQTLMLRKNEIPEELKTAKYNGLEDLL